MAKATDAKTGNTPTASSGAAQNAPAGAPTAETAAPSAEHAKPVLTREQGKALFATYDAAEAKLVSVEEGLEKAKAARSAAIEAIVAGFGHPGPFKRADGKVLTAAKTKGGGYTFRGERSRDVEEV